MTGGCDCWQFDFALGHDGHCCFLRDDRNRRINGGWRPDGEECHVPPRADICQEDSGSMTDCRPICDELATAKQLTHWGYGGPYTYRLCARHAASASGRHYPHRVEVQSD